MAWNLPKAWSPGFALPGYVRAEGLQRRAFVTEYPPDGTYDNPDVGNNGNFTVPKYIMKEGYGGGAFVTKWAPRGTYYGPKIPQFIEMPESEVTSRRSSRAAATSTTSTRSRVTRPSTSRCQSRSRALEPRPPT
jgi:hypothetical protein